MCIPYKKDIMQESHTYYLLSKYMDHTISTEELKTLRLLVNLSDDDELSLSLSHLWENGRPFEEVDERIIRDMFSGIQNRTRKERFVMVFRKLARIAAILLIPLLSVLSGYLYFNPVNQEEGIGNLVVHADRGERSGVTLPDGTQVKLNAESSLSYTHDFGRELRQVNLEGEAYFEVTKDSNRPFYVITEEVQVRVYGTEFNVNTHQPGKVHTVLVDGKVGIKKRGTTGEITMKPGELASFDRNAGTFEVKEVDVRQYVVWKDGYFTFENESLEQILNTLSLWYDVDVFFQSESAKQLVFTGYMKRYNDISEILNAITDVVGVNFTINGKTIIVSK